MDDTDSKQSTECDNPTRDTLAEGLLGLLKPTVDQLDDRVRATRISQLELKQQLESLNEELLKVREALNNHPDLEPYVKKLIACKHKVTVVLNVLQASQDRLTEIRHMIGIEKGVRTAILAGSEAIEPKQGPSGINQQQTTTTIETAYQNHINKEDFQHVYEPAEDSFLLIGALEKDLVQIKSKKPTFCLEVGSGSGVVISSLGMVIPDCFFISTDINLKACEMSRSTAGHNKVKLDALNMDLATNFLDLKFDIIIFNPPYVVTESHECNSTDIEASWAGGIKGREVTDRLIHMIPKKLAVGGVFYLLLSEDNIPSEVINIMENYGFSFEIVVKRRIRNEHLSIFKFFK